MIVLDRTRLTGQLDLFKKFMFFKGLRVYASLESLTLVQNLVQNDRRYYLLLRGATSASLLRLTRGDWFHPFPKRSSGASRPTHYHRPELSSARSFP